MSKPASDKPPDDIDEREARIIEALRFEDESLDKASARYLNLSHRGVNLAPLITEIDDDELDRLDNEIPLVGLVSDSAADTFRERRKWEGRYVSERD